MAKITNRWFSKRARANWERYLQPEFGDGREVHYLEIGTWEGGSACWTCEHLLTHERSTGISVDPYPVDLAPKKYSAEAVEQKYQQARENLEPWIAVGKYELFRETSTSWFRGYGFCFFQDFDVVYIDGDHRAPVVLDDSVNGWHVLKPGGVLIWDDYGGRRVRVGHVKTAVDGFLAAYAGHYEEFFRSHYQVAIRKTKEIGY